MNWCLVTEETCVGGVGVTVVILMLLMALVSYIQGLFALYSPSSGTSRLYGFSIVGYVLIAIIYGTLAGNGVI